MVWDHEKKYIFIHIPKTGGTTVEKSLSCQKHENGFMIPQFIQTMMKASQHFIWSDYVNHLGQQVYDSYLKFTIVRNPYTRLVSDFHWVSRDHMKNIKNINNIKNISNIDQYIDFAENIINENKYSENIFYDHFMPQYQYIFDNDNKLMVDKLFRQEKFEEIETFLKDNFGVDKLTLGEIGTTEKIELTVEQKEKIYNIYKKDFELLGYEK